MTHPPTPASQVPQTSRPRLCWRITSHTDLPLYMQGTFLFEDALELCCDWNYYHQVRDMAWPEKMEVM